MKHRDILWREIRKLAILLQRLDRSIKTVIFLVIDGLIAAASLYLAYALHENTTFPYNRLINGGTLIAVVPFFAIGLSFYFGIARTKLIMFNNDNIIDMIKSAFLQSVTLAILSYYFTPEVHRTVFAIYAVMFLALSILSRFVMLAIVRAIYHMQKQRVNVLIYGAGNTGQQLAAALTYSKRYNIAAFIDANTSLQRTLIRASKVYAPHEMPDIIKKHDISRAFLAIPSTSRARQTQIAEALKNLGVQTLTLPAFADMFRGRLLLDSLRPVDPNELLSRDTFEDNFHPLEAIYKDSTVLVTGAGGSIGSELARQIASFAPRKLILFDHSELALYKISEELTDSYKDDLDIISILGSVTDKAILNEIFTTYRPKIVLHAAAYKHVPLVECNTISGAENNIIGTLNTAQAALDYGASHFILISSDKAVRPTNVMGATKRLAEIFVQNLAARSQITDFSMVRFGNVLGSSGSVIPKFREQIERGGPVTVTDREVTRYFMTIPEAVQLVLIASSFTKSGDVFVLDMGESVRIVDLAEKMIDLSNLTVRSKNNPDGDIEIIETGLRPGEKLYEELLITNDMLPTPHDKIKIAKEACFDSDTCKLILTEIRKAIRDRDEQRLFHIFRHLCRGLSIIT